MALECCYLSAFVYETGLEAEMYVPDCSFPLVWETVRSGLTDWERFGDPETDVHVVMAYRESDGTAFVVFRGTDSIKDVGRVLSVVKKPVEFMRPGCLAHAGFLAQHEASQAAVRVYLDKHPSRSRVVATGHSLGGAVAILCSACLKAGGEKSVACEVFGAPRVGNRRFATSVSDTRRHVVGRDPVDRVPSRARWCHGGNQVLYRRGKRVFAESGDPWYRVARLPSLLHLGDHKVSAYMDCVALDTNFCVDAQ